MSAMWMKRALVAATLVVFAPACGDSADEGGDKVTESPNLGEKGSVKATAAEGGELSLPESGVTLSIPAGALEEDTEITAEIIGKKDLPEAANLAGNVVEFGPDGLNFLMPVALEIDLAGAKIPEGADVSIAWLDEDKNEWVDLSGSKMANGKVTAETTHFTKFVIRFIVNEDGDIVQDGGQCDTSGFKACGGDVEGTWNFEVGCVTVGDAIGGNEQDPSAKCFSIDAGVDFSGEVTFSKGTVSGVAMSSIEATFNVDKACLADAYSEMGGGEVTADSFTCDMFADAEDGETPPKVEEKGDVCTITQPEETNSDTIDGTYTVEGNTITITDTDVEEGDTSEPEAQEFCIQGDTLTLVTRDEESGTVFMITAKRK